MEFHFWSFCLRSLVPTRWYLTPFSDTPHRVAQRYARLCVSLCRVFRIVIGTFLKIQFQTSTIPKYPFPTGASSSEKNQLTRPFLRSSNRQRAHLENPADRIVVVISLLTSFKSKKFARKVVWDDNSWNLNAFNIHNGRG